LLGLACLALQWLSRPEAESHDGASRERTDRTIAFGGCLLAASAALVVWYTAAFAATHFYTRYFSLLSLVMVPLLGYVGLQASARMPRVVLGACGVLAIGFVGGVWTMACGGRSPSPMYAAQLPLVQAYVPDREAVGAGQSGTLGYFRDGVVNLDGKVNPEALRYRGRIGEYLQERNVRWFCDWPEYAEAYLGDEPEQHGWQLVAESGGFELLHLPDGIVDRRGVRPAP